MSIFQYIQEGMINEITADDKFNKFYDGKLDRNLFNSIVELDPTSNGLDKVGNYVDWLIKNKETLDVVDIPKLSNLLKTYDRLKTNLKPEHRDINKLDLLTFIEVMDNAEKDGLLLSKKDKEKARKKLAEKNSEVVYNDNEYIVVVPKTMQASQYYASGCAWCTGHQDDNVCYFNNDMYANGDLYIIYDKKTRKKWQMFWEQGKDHTVENKNCENEFFDPREEFAGTGLLDWIEEKGFPEEDNPDAVRDEAFARLGEILDGMLYISDRGKEILTDEVAELIYDSEWTADDIDDNLHFDVVSEIYNLADDIDGIDADDIIYHTDPLRDGGDAIDYVQEWVEGSIDSYAIADLIKADIVSDVGEYFELLDSSDVSFERLADYILDNPGVVFTEDLGSIENTLDEWEILDEVFQSDGNPDPYLMKAYVLYTYNKTGDMSLNKIKELVSENCADEDVDCMEGVEEAVADAQSKFMEYKESNGVDYAEKYKTLKSVGPILYLRHTIDRLTKHGIKDISRHDKLKLVDATKKLISEVVKWYMMAYGDTEMSVDDILDFFDNIYTYLPDLEGKLRSVERFYKENNSEAPQQTIKFENRMYI